MSSLAEQGTRQQSPVLEQHGDEQSPEAPVAVEEQVDGLELGMEQDDAQQRR